MLDENALDLIFRKARTHNKWQDKPVPDSLLKKAYDLAKMGPTSMNCSPMRVIFVRSQEAKERLKPMLMGSNREKTMAAPATAILANDTEFYDHMPRMFSHDKGARDMFAGNEKLARVTAMRNGTLQGAYFIMACRALGLDCGPMSGFNNAEVDAAFLEGTTYKSNFLCNIGYGDPEGLYPRGPRFDFDEACRIV